MTPAEWPVQDTSKHRARVHRHGLTFNRGIVLIFATQEVHHVRCPYAAGPAVRAVVLYCCPAKRAAPAPLGHAGLFVWPGRVAHVHGAPPLVTAVRPGASLRPA